MSREKPEALVSDSTGKVYSLPHLEAAGMKGGHFFRLTARELIPLPPGSELFLLPDRMPVGYDPRTGKYVTLGRGPLSGRSKRCFAVAAFVSPGFTATYSSAYAEIGRPAVLPLFSYAACAFYQGEFHAAGVRVDRELRQDLRGMNIAAVKKNAAGLKKTFSHNRLIAHLETCALTYGCPAARNFFLGRYEAPLPTSPSCNARCIGCISYQPKNRCPATQPRIAFVPTPEEIAEVALFHIGRVRDPVVSFGQGCEGEPLLAAEVLEKSIRLIRSGTSRGVINLNTNASRPETIARLFDAGLDSIRVSLNSVRPDYYTRYFKPGAYAFKDVMRSIKTAKGKKGFVSVNYLTMPGFTDSRDEIEAFRDFIETYRIDMVQWRNLNFDPRRYFRRLRIEVGPREMGGIKQLIHSLKKSFPELMMGYYNPSRNRMRRHVKK
ncbi:MAG: radical SAM protein [PVC group bacterium]